MSPKTSARHRAEPKSGTLTHLSKAVLSNAGSFGRQAAVVAAATGILASSGLQAAGAQPEMNPETQVASGSFFANTAATAGAEAAIDFTNVAVVSKPAPTVDAPAAQSDNDQSLTSKQATQSKQKSEAPAAQPKAQAAPRAQAPAATSKAPAAQPAPEAAPQVAPITGSGKSAVVAAAYQGVGRPYVWGGTTPSGWDCSGFTMWAYAQAGLSIPRVNPHTAMRKTSTPQPGDIIVRNGGSHISIYVGGDKEIGALNPSDGTKIMSVSLLDAYMGSASYYTLG